MTVAELGSVGELGLGGSRHRLPDLRREGWHN